MQLEVEQMRFAIIDDERPARSELKHQLLGLIPDVEIDEGDSGAAALQLAGEAQYDIFFLDINLGDIYGTVLVNAIKKMQPEAKIVFVTAYSEYAVDAFELNVEDYVMKPYDQKRLQKVLDKCLAKHACDEKKAVPKRIAITTEGKVVFENVENIVYIETYNRGCRVRTDKQEYYEGRSIGDYERKLENAEFFRIHKSYLINLNKVREVFPWGKGSFGLRVEGYDDILPIARNKIKLLRMQLEQV